MVWRYIYKRQYTDKKLTLRKSMNMRASAEQASLDFFFFAFSHSKITAISFNILLVLLILYLRNCRNIYIFRSQITICMIHYTCISSMRYTDKTLTLRKSMNMRASAERASLKFFAFSHSKTAISFNILLVLLILYLRNIYISGLSVSNYNLHDTYIINAVPCSYLYGVIIYKRNYTDKTLTLKKIYVYASVRSERD